MLILSSVSNFLERESSLNISTAMRDRYAHFYHSYRPGITPVHPSYCKNNDLYKGCKWIDDSLVEEENHIQN